RFLGGDADPIVEEGAGQRFTRKSSDQVPGEIDGVELDMRKRMQEGDAPRGRAESPAPRHFLGRPQQWAFGPRRGAAWPTAIAPVRQIWGSRRVGSAFAAGLAVARIATAPMVSVDDVFASAVRGRARF